MSETATPGDGRAMVLPTAIDRLRAGLIDLLGEIDARHVRATPRRYQEHRDGRLSIWHESALLRVHTCDADSAADPAVFLALVKVEWLPDWTALTPSEARTLGADLIAAANSSLRAAEVSR